MKRTSLPLLGVLLHLLAALHGTTQTGANAAACPHSVEAEMRA